MRETRMRRALFHPMCGSWAWWAVSFDPIGGVRDKARMIGPIVRSMRPHQWVKNAFVIAPLVFAEQLTDPGTVARAIAAFTLFSMASGAVYLVNDCFDVEKDRAHPTKRHRPIPAGELSVSTAMRIAAGLALLVVGAGAALSPWFALCAGLYLAQNLAYSRKLKHIAWLDVLTIATGFLLRILAGAFAIDVPVSSWLIACTFLLALYLAMGKRRHELLESVDESARRRAVLESYSLGQINIAMFGTALMTTAAYTAYTLDGSQGSFHSDGLRFTVPFIVLGLTRFFMLTGTTERADSPTERMIKDPLFVGNVLAWGGVILYLIYGAS